MVGPLSFHKAREGDASVSPYEKIQTAAVPGGLPGTAPKREAGGAVSDWGCLYFHCAPEGHKIDAMDRCDKVSFCVCSQGEPIEGDWALKFQSVIVFGRLSRVEDPQKVRQALTALAEKFTDDQAYIQKEIQTYAHRVQCLVLRPEQITGKQIRES